MTCSGYTERGERQDGGTLAAFDNKLSSTPGQYGVLYARRPRKVVQVSTTIRTKARQTASTGQTPGGASPTPQVRKDIPPRDIPKPEVGNFGETAFALVTRSVSLAMRRPCRPARIAKSRLDTICDLTLTAITRARNPTPRVPAHRPLDDRVNCKLFTLIPDQASAIAALARDNVAIEEEESREETV